MAWNDIYYLLFRGTFDYLIVGNASGMVSIIIVSRFLFTFFSKYSLDGESEGVP
jgi:hypothetical protein